MSEPGDGAAGNGTAPPFWPQVRPLIDPLVGVVAERNPGGIRVDPVVGQDLRFGRDEPRFRIALGRESLRRRPVETVGTGIPGLVAAGRELTHPAESSSFAHYAAFLFLVRLGSTSPAAMNSC